MDGLKRANDEFGHLSGNHALCVIADVLRNVIEKDDLLVRYGGDEFMLLSRNTQPEYRERLRPVIDKALDEQIKRQQIRYQVGVSIGYAMSTKANPLSMDECCELADKAMYLDKMNRKQ